MFLNETIILTKGIRPIFTKLYGRYLRKLLGVERWNPNICKFGPHSHTLKDYLPTILTSISHYHFFVCRIWGNIHDLDQEIWRKQEEWIKMNNNFSIPLQMQRWKGTWWFFLRFVLIFSFVILVIIYLIIPFSFIIFSSYMVR